MKKGVRAIAIFLVILLWVSTASAERDYFASYYFGRYSDNALNEIIRLQTNFKDSFVHVLSLGMELGRYKDWISAELEGQFGVHSGEQSHMEMNGSFTLP